MKVKVYIKPGAKANKLVSIDKDMFGDRLLTVAIRALPQKGAANAELVTFLADLLKIPKSLMKIERGLTSRNKTLSIKEETFWKLIEKHIK